MNTENFVLIECSLCLMLELINKVLSIIEDFKSMYGIRIKYRLQNEIFNMQRS